MILNILPHGEVCSDTTVEYFAAVLNGCLAVHTNTRTPLAEKADSVFGTPADQNTHEQRTFHRKKNIGFNTRGLQAEERVNVNGF